VFDLALSRNVLSAPSRKTTAPRASCAFFLPQPSILVRHGEFLRPEGEEASGCQRVLDAEAGEVGVPTDSAVGREIVRGFVVLVPIIQVTHIVVSRPKTLSDVTAQDHTVTVLQRTLQASNVSVLWGKAVVRTVRY
jgi:hypothetical protein